MPSLLDFIKPALLSPVAEQAVLRNVCPGCHAKTLELVHESLGMAFKQCWKCRTVYVVGAMAANDSIGCGDPQEGK